MFLTDSDQVKLFTLSLFYPVSSPRRFRAKVLSPSQLQVSWKEPKGEFEGYSVIYSTLPGKSLLKSPNAGRPLTVRSSLDNIQVLVYFPVRLEVQFAGRAQTRFKVNVSGKVISGVSSWKFSSKTSALMPPSPGEKLMAVSTEISCKAQVNAAHVCSCVKSLVFSEQIFYICSNRWTSFPEGEHTSSL